MVVETVSEYEEYEIELPHRTVIQTQLTQSKKKIVNTAKTQSSLSNFFTKK